jgi:hypothetical protein
MPACRARVHCKGDAKASPYVTAKIKTSRIAHFGVKEWREFQNLVRRQKKAAKFARDKTRGNENQRAVAAALAAELQAKVEASRDRPITATEQAHLDLCKYSRYEDEALVEANAADLAARQANFTKEVAAGYAEQAADNIADLAKRAALLVKPDTLPKTGRDGMLSEQDLAELAADVAKANWPPKLLKLAEQSRVAEKEYDVATATREEKAKAWGAILAKAQTKAGDNKKFEKWLTANTAIWPAPRSRPDRPSPWPYQPRRARRQEPSQCEEAHGQGQG